MIIPIVYDPISQTLFDQDFLFLNEQNLSDFNIIREEIDKIMKILIKLDTLFYQIKRLIIALMN